MPGAFDTRGVRGRGRGRAQTRGQSRGGRAQTRGGRGGANVNGFAVLAGRPESRMSVQSSDNENEGGGAPLYSPAEPNQTFEGASSSATATNQRNGIIVDDTVAPAAPAVSVADYDSENGTSGDDSDGEGGGGAPLYEKPDKGKSVAKPQINKPAPINVEPTKTLVSNSKLNPNSPVFVPSYDGSPVVEDNMDPQTMFKGAFAKNPDKVANQGTRQGNHIFLQRQELVDTAAHAMRAPTVDKPELQGLGISGPSNQNYIPGSGSGASTGQIKKPNGGLNQNGGNNGVAGPANNRMAMGKAGNQPYRPPHHRQNQQPGQASNPELMPLAYQKAQYGDYIARVPSVGYDLPPSGGQLQQPQYQQFQTQQYQQYQQPGYLQYQQPQQYGQYPVQSPSSGEALALINNLLFDYRASNGSGHGNGGNGYRTPRPPGQPNEMNDNFFSNRQGHRTNGRGGRNLGPRNHSTSNGQQINDMTQAQNNGGYGNVQSAPSMTSSLVAVHQPMIGGLHLPSHMGAPSPSMFDPPTEQVVKQRSNQLNCLVNGGKPKLEDMMHPDNLPFIDVTQNKYGPEYAVIRIINIPYKTQTPEIVAFIGRAAKIPNDNQAPIHIIMDRTTSKTNDAYVEFLSLDDAMNAMKRHNDNSMNGKATRLGDRPVEIELSSQSELMAKIFPHANGIRWQGSRPEFLPHNPNEPWENFKTFVTNEEITMLVKHVEIPTRSPFGKECPERPFECMISTIRKLPWYESSRITMEQRWRIFDACMNLMKCLIQSIKLNEKKIQDRTIRDYELRLNDQLLRRFTEAIMLCPGFSIMMKDNIACEVGMSEQDMRKFNMPRFANLWAHQHVLGPKPGMPLDVLEYYIALIRDETERGVLMLPIQERQKIDEHHKSTSPYWGYFWVEVGYAGLQGAGSFDNLTLAQAAELEWGAIDRILRRALSEEDAPTHANSPDGIDGRAPAGLLAN